MDTYGPIWLIWTHVDPYGSIWTKNIHAYMNTYWYGRLGMSAVVALHFLMGIVAARGIQPTVIQPQNPSSRPSMFLCQNPSTRPPYECLSPELGGQAVMS